MFESIEFDEISILIPGHAAEDLPTDLAEEPASSLLNAVCTAWHPALIARSRGIPVLRHADSIRQFTGRHVAIIPAPTEDWLPHDWKQDPSLQFHLLFHSCTLRQQWLDAVDTALTPHDSTSARVTPVLVDGFLAFGTTWLMVLLLSRRRHHFVDPDEATLTREIHQAAEASVLGDVATCSMHLRKCFELLLETRERFYPLSCCLVDMCIPSASVSVDALTEVLRNTSRLNLVASVSELMDWSAKSAAFREAVCERVAAGELNLLTGHQVEVRSSLVPLSALIHDLDVGFGNLQREFGIIPRHWARRRFGLLCSLPMVLRHRGFISAFHVALDDGLYPDRERSQFDWQAPDGSAIAATSRIPLAIDSAASMFRFPDRYNESMQDDTTAALYLARLPELQTPWLNDLRIAASFAAVFGEWTTFDALTEKTRHSRHRLRFDHGEYLSPCLIQAAVLHTESPVSGPATLHRLWTEVQSVSVLHAMLLMLHCEHDAAAVREQLQQIRSQLLDLELLHCEIPASSDDVRSRQSECADRLHSQLQTIASELSENMLPRIPQHPDSSRGLLIINPLPFSREVQVRWNKQWALPAANSAVDGMAPSASGYVLHVRMPPGGFVWLAESGCGPNAPERPPQSLLPVTSREAPLAEHLALRNRHFEVSLCDRTGGIASVVFHHSRANRLSQQVSFRFEHQQKLPAVDDEVAETTFYARTRLRSTRVVESGPLLGEIESTIEILSPVDGSLLAECRQIITVDRFRPQLGIRLLFDSIATDPAGHPWMTYYACRFAWENEKAAVSRGVLGQAGDFLGERFESPDYFEVADEHHRFVVATPGFAYHRRTGPRMLDSLLICEHERQREFQLVIEFDQAFPMRTALAAVVPPFIRESAGAVPDAPASGWFLGLSAKNVILADLTSLPICDSTAVDMTASVSPSAGVATMINEADERMPAGGAPGRMAGQTETDANRMRLRFVLLETEGVSVDCVLRTVRKARGAFQHTHDGSTPQTLEITDKGVVLHFKRFQLKEIELIF